MEESKTLILKLNDDESRKKDYFEIKDETYGTRYFIRDGQSYKEVTKPLVEPVRVLVDRTYTLRDIKSFIGYIGQHGEAVSGIIFYSESGVTLFFDEKNRTEQIRLPFTLSLEVKAFLRDGCRWSFLQKDFLKVIETFPGVVCEEQEILPYLRLFQMSKEVEFTSNIDPDNHTFVYKERNGQQTANIPKKLTLKLPYFEGSSNLHEIEVDLDIEMPKSENERPIFTLVNYKHERSLKKALDDEIKTIREGLPGWLFVHGAAA